MKTTIFISALLLAGCTTPYPDSVYDWKHSGATKLPMTVHIVSQDDVQGLCCNETGHVLACAYRLPEKNFCGVFTSYKKLPEETLHHEQRHCDGWEHQVLTPVKNNSVVAAKTCLTPDDVLIKR